MRDDTKHNIHIKLELLGEFHLVCNFKSIMLLYIYTIPLCRIRVL